MGTTEKPLIDLTLEERLMGRDLETGTKEKPCTECKHDVEHHTFEGEGRHDHVACVSCCEGSRFEGVTIETKN